MAYDNTNQGMLSRNDRKQSETHPDFKGQCDIDGKPYWIDGWINVGKDGGKMAGRKYFKLKFKAKDAQGAPATQAEAPPEQTEDVPF